eukprot:749490-Hanusia_phi.AAC.7
MFIKVLLGFQAAASDKDPSRKCTSKKSAGNKSSGCHLGDPRNQHPPPPTRVSGLSDSKTTSSHLDHCVAHVGVRTPADQRLVSCNARDEEGMRRTGGPTCMQTRDEGSWSKKRAEDRIPRNARRRLVDGSDLACKISSTSCCLPLPQLVAGRCQQPADLLASNAAESDIRPGEDTMSSIHPHQER